jgi:arylsulfatase A-like enzyme
MLGKPNVILIMTDQQRWDCISSAKGGWAPTPNIDKLAAEGVTFEQCYCAAPSCVPSRASFFNLKYPGQLNVMKNGDAWDTTWVSQFKAAGYRTVNCGKMHTQPFDARAGFDQRLIVENKDRFHQPRFYDDWDKHLKFLGIEAPNRNNLKNHPEYDTCMGAFLWPLPTELHWDAFVGKHAQWMIKEHNDKPLFMQIGFPGPHTPYDPPASYLDRVDDDAIPLPRAFDEADDIPPLAEYRRIMETQNHDCVRWHAHPSKEQLHRIRKYYAANVAMIDEQVGKIIDMLKQKNMLDNTIIVFTSDHGDAMGDHGQIQKWTMYDCVTRIPAIAWAPGKLPQGKTVAGLIAQMDLIPMIFDLAGVPLQDAGEAQNALDVATGNSDGREVVFSEHGKCNMLPGIEKMVMVRSQQFKLVAYPQRDYGELYDLVNDPDEMKNLWADTTFAAQRQQLQARCDQYLAKENA